METVEKTEEKVPVNIDPKLEKTVRKAEKVSEHSAITFMKNLINPEAYIKRHQPVVEEQENKEEEKKLKELEDILKDVSKDTNGLFVVGKYSDYYGLFSKAVFAVLERTNSGMNEKYKEFVHAIIGRKTAKTKLAQFKEKTEKYKGLYNSAEEQTDYYRDNVFGLAQKILEDKAFMQSYDASTKELQKQLKEIQNQQVDAYSKGDIEKAQKRGEEISKIKNDIRCFENKKLEYALAIETDSTKLNRKDIRLTKSSVMRDRYFDIMIRLDQDIENITDALKDNEKYGTPIDIRDGILTIRETAIVTGKLQNIDAISLEALGKIPNITIKSDSNKLNELTDAMNEERKRRNTELYNKALETTDNLSKRLYT